MVQAARSGKQNIAEGSVIAATSSKLEINLVSVARASLDELRLDLEDFLRHHKVTKWTKDSEKAKFIRDLAKKPGRSYETYRPYFEDKSAETAANSLICVIHQACFLLDRLKGQLAKEFEDTGGFSERMHRVRSNSRSGKRTNH